MLGCPAGTDLLGLRTTAGRLLPCCVAETELPLKLEPEEPGDGGGEGPGARVLERPTQGLPSSRGGRGCGHQRVRGPRSPGLLNALREKSPHPGSAGGGMSTPAGEYYPTGRSGRGAARPWRGAVVQIARSAKAMVAATSAIGSTIGGGVSAPTARVKSLQTCALRGPS